VETAATISGVIYPPDGDTARIAAFVPSAPAPAPAPEPAPPSPPAPATEPAGPSAVVAPPSAAKRFPALPVAAALLLLALAGAGGYLLSGERGPEPAIQSAGRPQAEDASALSPLEQARRFLRAPGNPAEGLDLSRRLPHTPEGRDAAFLLLGALAEQGQAEAMFDLAAFYDPADAAPRGSIRPDAEQAWQWYAKAEAAGRAEAAERKRRLRAYLEAEAAGGSAEAGELLARLR
jgi:TPR repeat protein